MTTTKRGATADLRRLGRALVRELGVVDSASSPDGVALSQCHILVELDGSGTLTAGELSERLVVDKAAISRAVALLADAGLVSLRLDATDRRRRPLALTAAGKRRAAAIHASADARVAAAVARLSARDAAIVTEGLALYVAALAEARTATRDDEATGAAAGRMP